MVRSTELTDLTLGLALPVTNLVQDMVPKAVWEADSIHFAQVLTATLVAAIRLGENSITREETSKDSNHDDQ